jgi:hypothetical protein
MAKLHEKAERFTGLLAVDIALQGLLRKFSIGNCGV